MMKAAIGFRAKTGRAIAVALRSSSDGVSFVWRQEVSLVDPRVPETSQPFHAVMDLPWPQAVDRAKPFVAAIERVAVAMLADMIRELRVAAIAVVGSPDRDLAKIGNPHIRAHAAEGIVFRQVIETAAKHHRIDVRSLSDRSPDLRQTQTRLASLLKKFGVEAGSPWRADEKTAATAAWLALRGK
jgi:hypothetical protein